MMLQIFIVLVQYIVSTDVNDLFVKFLHMKDVLSYQRTEKKLRNRFYDLTRHKRLYFGEYTKFRNSIQALHVRGSIKIYNGAILSCLCKRRNRGCLKIHVGEQYGFRIVHGLSTSVSSLQFHDAVVILSNKSFDCEICPEDEILTISSNLESGKLTTTWPSLQDFNSKRLENYRDCEYIDIFSAASPIMLHWKPEIACCKR